MAISPYLLPTPPPFFFQPNHFPPSPLFFSRFVWIYSCFVCLFVCFPWRYRPSGELYLPQPLPANRTSTWSCVDSSSDVSKQPSSPVPFSTSLAGTPSARWPSVWLSSTVVLRSETPSVHYSRSVSWNFVEFTDWPAGDGFSSSKEWQQSESRSSSCSSCRTRSGRSGASTMFKRIDFNTDWNSTEVRKTLRTRWEF